MHQILGFACLFVCFVILVFWDKVSCSLGWLNFWLLLPPSIPRFPVCASTSNCTYSLSFCFITGCILTTLHFLHPLSTLVQGSSPYLEEAHVMSSKWFDGLVLSPSKTLPTWILQLLMVPWHSGLHYLPLFISHFFKLPRKNSPVYSSLLWLCVWSDWPHCLMVSSSMATPQLYSIWALLTCATLIKYLSLLRFLEIRTHIHKAVVSW